MWVSLFSNAKLGKIPKSCNFLGMKSKKVVTFLDFNACVARGGVSGNGRGTSLQPPDAKAPEWSEIGTRRIRSKRCEAKKT